MHFLRVRGARYYGPEHVRAPLPGIIKCAHCLDQTERGTLPSRAVFLGTLAVSRGMRWVQIITMPTSTSPALSAVWGEGQAGQRIPSPGTGSAGRVAAPSVEFPASLASRRETCDTSPFVCLSEASPPEKEASSAFVQACDIKFSAISFPIIGLINEPKFFN